MIVSFGDKRTAKVWDGEIVKSLSLDIQHKARIKLRMIYASQDVNDLRVPPGNRLESLSGDWKGWNSIRINKQWRIVFQWKENNAHEVQIIDYHK